MNDVPTNIDAEIASNSSGGSFLGIGSTDHLTGDSDHIPAFPDHEKTRPPHDILFKGREKGFCEMFLVLFSHTGFGKNFEPCCNKFQSFFFEPGNDLTHKTALNPIGFHHNKCAVHLRFHSLLAAFFPAAVHWTRRGTLPSL